MPVGGHLTDPSTTRRVRPKLARRLRIRWLTTVVLIAAAFAVIVSRPGPQPVHQPTGDAAKAEQAINDLLAPRGGRDAMADLPPDFTAVTGHQPVHMRAPD